MTTKPNSEHSAIEPGERVFDEGGKPVGRVTGTTEEGFEIEAISPDGNDQEELPGQEFGEGYLMWRCTECGEMGDIDDGMPEECPNCGVEKEALTGVRED
jgi:rubrerythrin